MTNQQHEQPVGASEIKSEADGSVVEYTDIAIQPDQLEVAHNRVLRKEQLADMALEKRGTLLSLTYDLFVTHWSEVVFGSCIQGAVFELQMSGEPTQFSYLDGYLTVYLVPSPSHMHLCIGPHRGLKDETSSELARIRQCGRAAFTRTLGENGEPHSWSVVLWNGNGEQMVTFFLPSPFLDMAREKRLREPSWSHLSLWNTLRARYLGERVPQPLPAERGRGTCT
jgi:hypothetical protein